MDFYITPKEYEQAEKNGVDAFNLERRIRQLGWKKEKAINTPLRKLKRRKKWVELAKENGINYQCFMSRVNIYGWSEERAATEPKQCRSENARRNFESKVRKHPKKYILQAEKNNINYYTFYARMKKGWSLEDASTIPVISKKECGQLGKRTTISKYGDWNRFSFKEVKK